jgi:cytoskeletal protein CcmA (bactofilin family)
MRLLSLSLSNLVIFYSMTQSVQEDSTVLRNLRARTGPLTPAAKPAPKSNSNTVLGTSTTLKGTLESEGNVRIDGTFDGDITTQGDIMVGEVGRVEGDVKGQNVAVGGVIRGDIEAKRITVQSTGRVWGDLTTGSLTTEEGAFIQGVITMQTEEAFQENVDELLSDLEAQMAEVVEKKSKK